MKKWFFTSLAVMMLLSLFSMPVFAGDINAAEQRIISAISAVYEYDGAYYKVKDSYVTKVANYLSRDDIDLSGSEVDDYLDQFYANIAVGISSGYMECVGKVKEEEKPIQKETEEEQNEGSESGLDNNNENSSVTTQKETPIVILQEELEVLMENSAVADIDAGVGTDDNIEVVEESIETTEQSGSKQEAGDQSIEEVSSEEETTEEEKSFVKDYFDAEPFQKGISLGMIAIAIVVVVAIAMGGILLWHKNKRYKR